ncbi:MAG: helix-turn-helix domain-containing protein [Burkholderiaceae bacterium]|jgi:transcriptional regulator with XRE-family HTH domain|nr:helix-turn-helix domain-containing protein [Burkholderiaceae bacterium]
MSEIARAAGLTREVLYKALRAGAQPRLDTVQRVCTALGVRLVEQPTETTAPVPVQSDPVRAAKVRQRATARVSAER